MQVAEVDGDRLKCKQASNGSRSVMYLRMIEFVHWEEISSLVFGQFTVSLEITLAESLMSVLYCEEFELQYFCSRA